METFAALALFADNTDSCRLSACELSANSAKRLPDRRSYEVIVIVQVRPVSPRAPLAVCTARGRASDPVKLDQWAGRFRRTLERAIAEAEENVLEQLAADARQIGLFDEPHAQEELTLQ